MTYSQYLQSGGEINPQTQQSSEPDELTQLVLTAMGEARSQEEQAKQKAAQQQIQQIMQAAQEGNPEAKELAQKIQTLISEINNSSDLNPYPETMKCGGAVKKIRKACGGKKMEKGGDAEEMKCGGKSKKKMEKGGELNFEEFILKCGGAMKKIAKGKKIQKPIVSDSKGAKAPCPCTLKQVGGKLIEVFDCKSLQYGGLISYKEYLK